MVNKVKTKSFLLLAFGFLIGTNVLESRKKIFLVERGSVDVFDYMLNPETSTRNNFGELFKKTLRDNDRIHGNFLEIGGGSGKFFDHNMKSFGEFLSNYVIIEPYANEEFTKIVQGWKVTAEKSSESSVNITVIHDFSTSSMVIYAFPDRYFDFVYVDGDHSYKGSKSDLRNYYPKVKRGGVIAGHDYCCSRAESKEIVHAPWCGKYIYPHSTSSKSKDGKEKASWCGIYKGAEEFAKENNFYWFYTLEGRRGVDNAGLDNPSYFTFKQS